MAALLLQVGSLDLTAYVRAQPDEGLDPAGGGTFLTQQFAGSLALTDGQVSVGESAGNREFGAPLYLNATTTNGALALLQQLRQACVQGAQVQFRPEGATNISYLDLEAADIHPVYNHFLLRAGWLKVNVVLYTRPFAHTGTTRLVASAAATPGPVVEMTASGVLGDTAALAEIRFPFVPSVAVGAWLAGYAVAAHPSYRFVRTTANGLGVGNGLASAGATVFAASGVYASQALGLSPPIATDYPIAEETIAAVDMPIYAGQQRVFALARHRVSPATAVSLSLIRADPSAALSTAIASYTSATQWGILDLGSLGIPDAPGNGKVAGGLTYQVTCRIASGASIVASPAVQLNALIFAPLDIAAGFVVSTKTPVRYLAIDALSDPIAYTGGTGASGSADSVRSQLSYIAGDFRGAAPRIPPGPTAARVMAWTARLDDAFAGTDVGGQSRAADVRVRERWTFFR